MDRSSTLKESENSLIGPVGFLDVVGSNRLASAISRRMASPFAIGAFGSTLPIMVIVALGAQ
ncbi:hypothetical protein Tco_1026622, partial [Tanacetum coccineum]